MLNKAHHRLLFIIAIALLLSFTVPAFTGIGITARAESYKLLTKGSKGADVVKLQERLIELGYLTGTADGDFGSKTRDAVKEFQRCADLTVDGKAGKQTQQALFSENAPRVQRTNVLAGETPLLVNRKNPVDKTFVPDDLVLLSDVIPDGLCQYKSTGLMGVREAV